MKNLDEINYEISKINDKILKIKNEKENISSQLSEIDRLLENYVESSDFIQELKIKLETLKAF